MRRGDRVDRHTMVEQLLLKGILDERDRELVAVEDRRQRMSLSQEDSVLSSARRLLFLDLARAVKGQLSQGEVLNRLLMPVERPTVGDYAALMQKATQDTHIAGADKVRACGPHIAKREDYGKISGGDRIEALRGLIQRTTYNSGFPIEAALDASVLSAKDFTKHLGRDGDRYHAEGAIALDMTWPELQQIRERLREVRARFGVQVWLPCHSEPGVADMNVEYAANAVDPSRVLCVNTNRREVADVQRTQHYLGRTAQRYPDVTFGLQDEVLSCINWKRVAVLFNVPLTKEHLPEAQAKGLTLLALALIAEARNDLQEGYVAFHDTDIINPREYLGLEYLTIPLWASEMGLDASNLLSTYVARTGSGRNNQPIHSALNALVAEPGGETRRMARELALNVSLAPWPITGERIIRADIVRRLPWTNDMTIESQINVMLAGESVSRSAFTTAHAISPYPKLECADVTVDREWRMMNYCAHHHRVVIEHCNTIHKVLGDWSIEDIKGFNEQTSTRIIPGIITNDAGATGSIAYATRPPYMLPSVGMLVELGLVDVNAVKARVKESRAAILCQA